MRVFNFSAGPSTMPIEVLKQIQAEFLDYNGSGMNPLEMSHRGKTYDEIHNEAINLVRELLGVSDDYYVLLLQGGATQQFEAVPMNLLGKNNKADYVNTGHWSSNAIKCAVNATAYANPKGDILEIASSKDKNFTYIPEVSDLVRKDARYVHITTNNTIRGTRYTFLPKTEVPIVADMSSNILSEVVDVNKFAVIYAGAQKNIACAGITLVIVKKELVDNDYTLPYTPLMYRWKTQADKNSLYNTCPTFNIYVMMRMLQYLKNFGGIAKMQQFDEAKSFKLYDFIDNSALYTNNVNKRDRSLMNIVFTTSSEELDAKFVKEAAAANIISVKGHKTVGGLRASLYNAMTMEGVDYLIDFMKKFESQNK